MAILSGVEKTNSNVIKVLLSSIKVITMSVLFLLIIFLFAYIALQYGVKIESLVSSVRTHWLIWLFIRFVIYGLGAFLLFHIYRRTKSNIPSEYKRLVKATIISVLVIESINLAQLLGE